MQAEPTNELFAKVYQRLKAMAGKNRARAGAGFSLSTTEVVHELYLRMSHEDGPKFIHDLEFFSYAARAMRHVFIDLARRKLSLKKGGDLVRVELSDPSAESIAIDPAQAIELDSIIRALQAESPRAAQVLELHFFAGLPKERICEIMNLSPRSVDRDWRYARSYIATMMSSE